MDTNVLLAQAAAAADTLEDQSVAKEGGNFSDEPYPAGKTPARFIGYVELGLRKQRPWQGKEKPPAEEVRLYFELNGKKHQREVVVDGVAKTFTNVLSLTLSKRQGEKASFYKLFKKMQYGRDSINHFHQMLGEGFLVDIVHNTVAATADKPARTFANMHDADGNYLIGAPMYQADPMDDSSWAPIPVPAATVAMKLLLWKAPSKEQWASIFIDGTRTVKEKDGSTKEVSKNWLQEDIVSNALNFPGSPLEALLSGLSGLSLENDMPTAAPESAAKAPSAAAATTAPKAAETAPSEAPAASADPLSALGL